MDPPGGKITENIRKRALCWGVSGYFSAKNSLFFIFCLFSEEFPLYLRGQTSAQAFTTIFNPIKSKFMNKTELIDKIAEGSGLTKTDSKKALEAAVSAIQAALVAGDKVSLVGFGTFSVSERPAHEGINPATKEKIQIAAKKLVKFKAGAELADAIN